MRRWTGFILVVALFVAGLATAAVASPSDEAEFVTLINQSRAQEGLAPLSSYSDLVDDARRHTAEMIAEGTIFHSTSSELAAATTGWTLIGENVGMGPNPSLLHVAFMNSQGHRENILGPYDRVGVGVDRDANGTMFVTVLFMQSAAAPPPPRPPPRPPPPRPPPHPPPPRPPVPPPPPATSQPPRTPRTRTPDLPASSGDPSTARPGSPVRSSAGPPTADARSPGFGSRRSSTTRSPRTVGRSSPGGW